MTLCGLYSLISCTRKCYVFFMEAVRGGLIGEGSTFLWAGNEAMDERRAQQDRISRRTGDRATATRRHAAQPGDDLGCRLNDNLYVRSYKGSSGSWFRAAQTRHEGRIRAGAVEKDVTFVEETDPGTNDRIERHVSHQVSPLQRTLRGPDGGR
jgi:hypothetical protein